MLKKLILIPFLVLCLSPLSFAQDVSDEDDDSFDPFADYSEFIEASTEESDLNFFKFGRMMSAGAWGGLRTFTGNMGDNQSSSTFFGLFFTYYFSLQFAAQVSYVTGSHDLRVPVSGAPDITATLDISNISFHAKYFINTQNLTKNIAQFNPYIIGGFSLVSRRGGSSSNGTFTGSDGAGSFDIGAGVEYLFNNKKTFVGFQLLYQSASFPKENTELLGGNPANIPTGTDNAGDPILGMVSSGLNF